MTAPVASRRLTGLKQGNPAFFQILPVTVGHPRLRFGVSIRAGVSDTFTMRWRRTSTSPPERDPCRTLAPRGRRNRLRRWARITKDDEAGRGWRPGRQDACDEDLGADVPGALAVRSGVSCEVFHGRLEASSDFGGNLLEVRVVSDLHQGRWVDHLHHDGGALGASDDDVAGQQ